MMRAIRTWPLPALIALPLLILAIVFDQFATKPMEAQLQSAEYALSNATRTVARETDGGNVNEKLAAFYQFFDQQAGFTDWLSRIYSIAKDAGIELRQGDYQRAQPDDIPLTTYTVTLPVSGDYTRIRAFSEEVLDQVPVAALDHIAFHRENADQTQVQADLQFTIYLPRR